MNKLAIILCLLLIVSIFSYAQFTGENADGYDKGSVNLIEVPTVTTQPVNSISLTSATGNGIITATGGENCDKRMIIYYP
jgi:hypothetical protein